METIGDLNSETIEALKELVETNADSVKGYKAAADAIEDAEISSFFKEAAIERFKHVAELRVYLGLNNEDASTDGSVPGKLHRFWINVRGKVQDGDSHAILSEAERGEDVIKAAYEDVLKATAGSALNDVLLRQYSEVKKNHDRVLLMRNARA